MPSSGMCSYNLINGRGASENEYLQQKVLKHDWGGLYHVRLGRRPFHG